MPSLPGTTPDWIPPQLCRLVEGAPSGDDWLHEIKFDGYRLHARIVRGDVRLLTRTGLDWTERYPEIAAALRDLSVRQAYIDGELCGLRGDGRTSFALIQQATDKASAAELVFFVFDLLHHEGQDLTGRPLIERKSHLEDIVPAGSTGPIRLSEHHRGDGPTFLKHACRMELEGVVSKRADAPYKPNDRGLWTKAKCLNAEEFVVVGWTDPEGSRPYLGALLLAHYDPDGRLTYAGRAGTGMSDRVLSDLHAALVPLAIQEMPLDLPPPRKSRFGSPLVLSRVHWVRPEMVVAVTYLTWTDDHLLRHVTFQGVRDDKPAAQVQRPEPGSADP